MPQGLGQNLYGDLSIEENIDFFARIRMVPTKELAELPAQAEIEKALDGIACHDVQTTEPELEDVFIALLQRKNLAEPQPESKSEEAKEKPREKTKDTSRAGQTSPDTQEIATEAKAGRRPQPKEP